MLRLGRIGVDPAQQRSAVGVRRKPMQLNDVGPHDDFFTEEFDSVRFVGQDPAKASHCLKAHKNNGTLFPP